MQDPFITIALLGALGAVLILLALIRRSPEGPMTIADPDNDDYESGYDYDPSGRIPGHLRRFCWRCLLLWVCVAIVVTGIYAVLYHGGFLR